MGDSMGTFMHFSVVINVAIGLKFRGTGSRLLPGTFNGVVCGPYRNAELFVFIC